MHPEGDISRIAGWIDFVRAISAQALGAVSVVGDDQKLMGVITDGDLRRTIEKTEAEALGELTARTMMTRSPVTATPEMLAYEALRLMEDRPSQISVLPVVDDKTRCLGLIRLHDIVRIGL